MILLWNRFLVSIHAGFLMNDAEYDVVVRSAHGLLKQHIWERSIHSPLIATMSVRCLMVFCIALGYVI